MLSPEVSARIKERLGANPGPGADYLLDVPELLREIEALEAKVRNDQDVINQIQGDAASALATKNVAREILTAAQTSLEKQIKISNLEDDKGQKMVDSTLTDIKARIDSALRVL